MLQPTLITWLLVLFGAMTLLPLLFAQLAMLLQPNGQKAKDILVGKDEDWRDKTHFRSAYGMAWADWLLVVPSMVIGSIGVLMGYAWAYVLWGAAGAIILYINIVLWFMEKEYVYPSRGALVYYSYYWGFFILWGGLALAYSVLRFSVVDI